MVIDPKAKKKNERRGRNSTRRESLAKAQTKGIFFWFTGSQERKKTWRSAIQKHKKKRVNGKKQHQEVSKLVCWLKNNWADPFNKFHFDVRQKLTEVIDVFYNGLENY